MLCVSGVVACECVRVVCRGTAFSGAGVVVGDSFSVVFFVRGRVLSDSRVVCVATSKAGVVLDRFVGQCVCECECAR